MFADTKIPDNASSSSHDPLIDGPVAPPPLLPEILPREPFKPAPTEPLTPSQPRPIPPPMPPLAPNPIEEPGIGENPEFNPTDPNCPWDPMK